MFAISSKLMFSDVPMVAFCNKIATHTPPLAKYIFYAIVHP